MAPRAPVAVTPGSRRIVIAGTLLALFLAALDQTVVSTALPRIIADLQGIGLLAWVFSAYMLASTIVVPLIGKLGDQFGRKPIFLAAIVIFIAGSVAAGAAQSMLQLVVFRAVQGVGGGMLFATSFAIVGDLYSPLERGRIQGLFAAMFGISSVLGPALGGWITDATSWRWIFYINLPVGVLALAVVSLGMPWTRPLDGRRPRLDLWGSFTLTAALLPFLLALVWAGDRYPWRSWEIAALIGLATVALAAFVQAERRASEPILPLQLFRNRTFAVSAVILLLSGAGMFGAITMLPLFLQGAQQIPAARAGSLMIPLSLALVGGSATAGQLMTRTGRYRFLVIGGAVIMTAGLLLLSRINVDTPYAQLVPRMILVGAGLGLTMPVFAVIVQNALPYQMLGVATSAVQFFRSVGGTLGVAVFTGIMLHRFRSGLDGTAADVPAVTGNLSKLLNERGATEVQRAYAESAPSGVAPWSQVLELAHVSQSEAIAGVFLIAACVVAVTFVFAWLLPELELQRVSPQEMARRLAAQQTAHGAQPTHAVVAPTPASAIPHQPGDA